MATIAAEPGRQTLETVFVLDSSPETVELVCAALDDAGFHTAGVSEAEVRLNQGNFEALVRVHQPAAIVFDIRRAAPEEWAFLAHVRQTVPCRDIPLVLTTSERSALRNLMRFPLSQTLDKPYDLPALVAAVERAVLARSPSAPPLAPWVASPLKGHMPGALLQPVGNSRSS